MTEKERVRKKIFRRISLILTSAFLSLTLIGFELHAQEIIDPHSGRLLLTTTDFILPAGAVNLEIRRSLQQRSDRKGLLGNLWRLNWEDTLMRIDPMVLIEEATGIISFRQEGKKSEYVGVSGDRVVFDEQGTAVRTRTDGTRDFFNEQGRLIERDLRNGNKVILHYAADGRLSHLEGLRKSAIRFFYDEQGQIIRIETSTGTTVRYTYVKYNLTEVQVNGGPVLRYAYDTTGALVRFNDTKSGAVQFSYDSEGRVLSRQWADGSLERYEYDDENNIRRHIDEGGGITTIHRIKDTLREEITDPLGNKTIIEYNDRGQPLMVTGPTGAVAQITYDSPGRIVSVKDPLGQVSRLEYLGNTTLTKKVIRSDGSHLKYEYDQQYNLKTIKTGNKTFTSFTYTTDGLVESVKGVGIPEEKFAYYPNGRLKSSANALGHRTQFEYDKRGNLIRKTNPLGGVTVKSYDAQNRLVSEIDPSSTTTRYTYDSRGRLNKILYPDKTWTNYEYDALGRVIAETDSTGQTVQYRYERSGRVEKVEFPGDQTEQYRYDSAGNLTEISDYLGLIISYEYDSLGRVIRELQPGGLEISYTYDRNGNLIRVEDIMGAKTEYRYNILGELTDRLDTLGRSTRYQYDQLGHLLKLTNRLGRIKQFSYNPVGRVAIVREPSGDQAKFEYDPVGRLNAIHRPGGGISRFQYDAMGNIVSETDPLGNESRHSYDLAGRLISEVNASGQVTRYQYDLNGRLTGKQFSDGQSVAFRYDQSGKLVEMDDGKFPVRYSHDNSGRVIQTEYPAIKKSLGYEYNSNGLIKRMVLPDGQDIRYEFNNLYQLAGIILPDNRKIRFTYDAKDRQKTISYPNGITGQLEYDTEGHIVKISYERGEDKSIAGYDYRFDPEGNVIESYDIGGHAVKFRYDPAEQLVEELYPDSVVRYTYGSGGNRIEMQKENISTKYQYDNADHIVKAGNEKMKYDNNGNLIERRGTKTVRYEYDPENRLVKVSGPAGTEVSYGYDANGNRALRKDNNGLTYFLYEGFDLIQELNEDYSARATYVYAPWIDRPVAMIRNGKYYFYHTDRLGSVRHMTDDQGDIVASYNYDAFGNIISREGSISNPFTFTAREYDSATGLYYYRARYYDASLGRFLSRDPIPAEIDEPLDENPYLYVRNNPLRFIDPLGTDEVTYIEVNIQSAGNIGIENGKYVHNPAQGGNLRQQLKLPINLTENLRFHQKLLAKYKKHGMKYAIKGQESIVRSLQAKINAARSSGVNVPSSKQPTIEMTIKPPDPNRTGSYSRSPSTASYSRSPSTASYSRSSSSGSLITGETAALKLRLPEPTVSGSKTAALKTRGGVLSRSAKGGAFGAAAGLGISAIIEGLNYNSCMQEGILTPDECQEQFISSLIQATLFGLGTGAILAATGGTSAGFILGITATTTGGTAMAVSTGKAIDRSLKAEKIAAQRIEIAGIIARLRGEIVWLRKKGETAQKEMENHRKTAKKLAENALTKMIKIAPTEKNYCIELASIYNKCSVEAPKERKKAAENAKEAKKNAGDAKKLFEAIQSMLTQCKSNDHVIEAEGFVEVAQIFAESAAVKYGRILKADAVLKEITAKAEELVPRVKECVIDYCDRIRKGLKPYKDDIQTVRSSSEKAKKIFDDFADTKAPLLIRITQSQKDYPFFSSEFEPLRIDTAGMIPLKAIDFRPLLEVAKKAEEKFEKIERNILTLKQTGLDEVEEKISRCTEESLLMLEIGGPAAEAMLALGDYKKWLEDDIPEKKKICLAKLSGVPTSQGLEIQAYELTPNPARVKQSEKNNPFSFMYWYTDDDGEIQKSPSLPANCPAFSEKVTSPGTHTIACEYHVSEFGEILTDEATLIVVADDDSSGQPPGQPPTSPSEIEHSVRERIKQGKINRGEEVMQRALRQGSQTFGYPSGVSPTPHQQKLSRQLAGIVEEMGGGIKTPSPGGGKGKSTSGEATSSVSSTPSTSGGATSSVSSTSSSTGTTAPTPSPLFPGELIGYLKASCGSGWSDEYSFLISIGNDGKIKGHYDIDEGYPPENDGSITGDVTNKGELSAVFHGVSSDCTMKGNLSRSGSELKGSGTIHCTGSGVCDGTWYGPAKK